ncbi:MAG: RHS repeat-associated core domain-containing protein, partial [Aggregatilineales bacterium]
MHGTDNITFDDNGNMTMRGTNAYVWDNANRLLSYGGASYAYDGNSNRISQTVSSTVMQYLVDTQPALSKVLRQSDGTNTIHFIHVPRGIFSQYDGTDWEYTVQDALGSVRAMADATGAIQNPVNYGEYGIPDTATTGFAFTGEQRDANGLQYHRARYYDPVLGVWASLDPLETANRYGYVSGNPVNRRDSSGLFDESTCAIESGDYLEKIALQVGVRLNNGMYISSIPNPSVSQRREAWRKIAAMNGHLTNPSRIFPGQQLRSMPANAKNVTCVQRSGIVDNPPPGSGIISTGGSGEQMGGTCSGGSPQPVIGSPETGGGERDSGHSSRPCQVEIAAYDAIPGTQIFHAFIIFTSSDGIKYEIRAGQGSGRIGSSGGLSDGSSESSSNSSPSSESSRSSSSSSQVSGISSGSDDNITGGPLGYLTAVIHLFEQNNGGDYNRFYDAPTTGRREPDLLESGVSTCSFLKCAEQVVKGLEQSFVYGLITQNSNSFVRTVLE